MPMFVYRAKKTNGEQISETVEADSPKTAAAKIQALGHYPISIEPTQEKITIRQRLSFLKVKNISHKDVTIFFRRLADTVKGGLPLARALTVLRNQTENGELKRVTGEILVMIQEGLSLSDAVDKYPAIFPTVYAGMIKAGESAGILDTVLNRIAQFNDKEEEMQYKVKSALAYPAVMSVVGFASVLFLLGFVIPKFEIMFQDMKQTLPLPTRIIVLLSDTVLRGWWIIGIIGAICGISAKKYYTKPAGKLFFDKLKISIPLFGSLIKKELIARFVRMLSVLLENGVPILDALSLSKNSISNGVLSSEIDTISKSVKEGQRLGAVISRSGLFPEMMSDIITVGEETGNLDVSLSRVADLYEREVEYSVKTLTSLIEPVVILFMGLVVAFIAMSMLLPVFQMSTVIK